MDVPFPHRAVRMRTVATPVGRGRLAGRSLSGVDRPVATAGGHWRVQAQFMVPYQARGAWNAFLAQMQGVLGVTEVPVFRSPRMATTDGRKVEFCNPVAGVDGADTFEHFGFSRPTGGWVTLAEAAALRATRLVLDVDPFVEGLRPGDLFSIDGRLHEVLTHYNDPAENDRDVVQIWPPLRAAGSQGQVLDVTYPTCRVRFATEAEGRPENERLPMWICAASFIESAQ